MTFWEGFTQAFTQAAYNLLPAIHAELTLTPVDSSNVQAAGYDPNTRTMVVKFHREGRYYAYFDVSQKRFDNFMEADSKGTYLNQHIKPNHDFKRL